MTVGAAGRDSGMGLPLSVTAPITPKQWIAGGRAATRTITVAIGIWIAVLLLAGIALRWWLFLVLAAALGGLLYVLPRRIYQGRLDGPRTWTITVNEQEYRQESDRGEASAFAWTNFSKAERIGGHWVLRAGRTVVTLPADVFTDDQSTAFRALLVRKRLLAGHAR